VVGSILGFEVQLEFCGDFLSEAGDLIRRDLLLADLSRPPPGKNSNAVHEGPVTVNLAKIAADTVGYAFLEP
jgi:hypothetical protein